MKQKLTGTRIWNKQVKYNSASIDALHHNNLKTEWVKSSTEKQIEAISLKKKHSLNHVYWHTEMSKLLVHASQMTSECTILMSMHRNSEKRTHKAVYICSFIPEWFIQSRLGDNWKISYVC